MIISDRFFGRLGNNIIQIGNIIAIAIEYKHPVKFKKKHDLLDVSIIEKYFENYNNDEIIRDNLNYFCIKNLPFPITIFSKNVEERCKILREAFLIKNINKLDENDVVVHIRSGDIFSSDPHPNYVPPPLSYYIKKLEKRKYKTIHIVCEDTKNPVVNELLKLYKNAYHEEDTLESDIRKILGATNIIFSVGTFVPSLMIFSENIKYICGKHCGNKELTEYYKFARPWKNTVEQREYILTYEYGK